ncbi:hypothetical protein [Rickettsia endosymbiont of Halotydeus destructor]|uniref:hypothetical protein n=1 Tax=Rickettsia endosymbiont of Halotydeus destructor TaxID=2996754 RepID=UPI003BB040F4
MIRKIFLFVFLTFTIIWFAIAYTVKDNVVNLIKNSESDNIKISYENIKISGYPINWKIIITQPKVKFIDHVNSKEFLSENITLSLDFSLKKVNLDTGNYIKEIENFGDKSLEYFVRSDEAIKGIVKLNKPLYKIAKDDNLKSITKSIQLNNKSLSVLNEDKEIFNLKNLNFSLGKKNSQESENISILLGLDYASLENYLNFKNATLDLVTSLNFVQGNNESNTLKDFTIERFIFICDNDAKVDLKGGMEFFTSKLPQGKLSFELENYHAIIDKLVPNNIILSKKIIKAIIAKAVSANQPELLPLALPAINTDAVTTIEKVNFDIEFSDKGINIGSINLLELQFGENKGENPEAN